MVMAMAVREACGRYERRIPQLTKANMHACAVACTVGGGDGDGGD